MPQPRSFSQRDGFCPGDAEFLPTWSNPRIIHNDNSGSDYQTNCALGTPKTTRCPMLQVANHGNFSFKTLDPRPKTIFLMNFAALETRIEMNTYIDTYTVYSTHLMPNANDIILRTPHTATHTHISMLTLRCCACLTFGDIRSSFTVLIHDPHSRSLIHDPQFFASLLLLRCCCCAAAAA